MESIKLFIASLSQRDIEAIGTVATFICVVVSGKVALSYLQKAPRLFTIMALFACSWALVLGRYANPQEQLWHLTTNLASFLDVYIGGLLFFEASTAATGRRVAVSSLQVLALWLLPIIAVPKALQLAGVPLLDVWIIEKADHSPHVVSVRPYAAI